LTPLKKQNCLNKSKTNKNIRKIITNTILFKQTCFDLFARFSAPDFVDFLPTSFFEFFVDSFVGKTDSTEDTEDSD